MADAVDLTHLHGIDYRFTSGFVHALMDAYQLISQAVESPLANVCDINYTSLAKIRKEWLPPRRGPLAEVHQRLREIGRSYIAAR
jgi:hypothetical protein